MCFWRPPPESGVSPSIESGCSGWRADARTPTSSSHTVDVKADSKRAESLVRANTLSAWQLTT